MQLTGMGTMRVKAVINRKKFNELLNANKWSIVDFHELLRQDGLQIEYQAFSSMLNNRTGWSLTYAMLVCNRLNIQLEKLFYLEKMD